MDKVEENTGPVITDKFEREIDTALSNSEDNQKLGILRDDQGRFWDGQEFGDLEDAKRYEPVEALKVAVHVSRQYESELEGSHIYIRAVEQDEPSDSDGVHVVNTDQAMNWPHLEAAYKRGFGLNLDRDEALAITARSPAAALDNQEQAAAPAAALDNQEQAAAPAAALDNQEQAAAPAAALDNQEQAAAPVVVQAVHRIGSRALKNGLMWAIAAGAFVAIFAMNVPFPAIVAGAALIGYIGGRVTPDKFRAGGAHRAADKSYGPALIDDNTPIPSHALFRWSGSLRVAAMGCLLWLIPMAFLLGTYGWDHTLTQMGWFFTKAALLTFGGAYAVLPYIYQGAVGHYSWLTPTQMVDGLALGEAT